jgi:hypothetical protein
MPFLTQSAVNSLTCTYLSSSQQSDQPNKKPGRTAGLSFYALSNAYLNVPNFANELSNGL